MICGHAVPFQKQQPKIALRRIQQLGYVATKPRIRQMSEFKIKLARVEAFDDSAQGKHIERGPIGFHVPIYLQGRDFDDTEIVQAAKSSLFRMFEELADLSKVWDLSAGELERLSKMNLRPVE